MKSGFFPSLSFVLAILFGLAMIGAVAAPAQSAAPVQEVVQKAVSRAQQAEQNSGQPGYSYTKATVTEELDASGKVKERKEKVYQVVFQGGTTHLKLLQINGHSPDEAELKKIAENDANVRKLLADPKARKGGRDNFLTAELVSRFDFSLAGHQTINGRDAYQISFQPKSPEAPEHGVVDRLLNRISGTLWIDAQEFEIARADVQLKSEVNLLGGALASLKKLAYTMTRTRVADGIWLSTSSSGDFQGRKLIDRMRIKTKSLSSNFRPLG